MSLKNVCVFLIPFRNIMTKAMKLNILASPCVLFRHMLIRYTWFYKSKYHKKIRTKEGWLLKIKWCELLTTKGTSYFKVGGGYEFLKKRWRYDLLQK